MGTKKSGFTLIEVLISIAVLSVLLGVVTKGLTSYMQKLRLNQATTAFVADLYRIGDDALRFSQRMDIDESKLHSGKIVWTSGGEQFGNLNLPHGATISAYDKAIPNQEIWFSGRGLPFQQVLFEIELNDLSREVVLLPTGIVVQK